jgi:L-aspartate oxidase
LSETEFPHYSWQISYRAQGGIAAELGSEDTSTAHYQDTIAAGCQFHNGAEVKELVGNGPSLIQALIRKGVQFDTDSSGQLELRKAHIA